jgi:hypothetical protein
VRHYTTQEAADKIEASGEIRVGPSSGKAFFTPDTYESASEAQQLLALPNTPEGYFEVPFSRLESPSPFTEVGERYRQPGGGSECFVTCTTNARGLSFQRIGP